MFRHKMFQRIVSWLTLFSFTSTLLVPLPILAQPTAPFVLQTLQPPSAATTNSTLLGKGRQTTPAANQQDYTTLLNQLQTSLQQALSAQANSTEALTRSNAGKNLALQQIRQHYQGLKQEEKKAQQDFAAAAAHIKKHGLPSAIVKRQQDALDQFSQRSAALAQGMAKLESATQTKGDTHAALTQVATLLNAHQASQHVVAAKRKTANSVKLPWGKRQAGHKNISLGADAHEHLFPRSVLLASTGSLSGIKLPDAPLPLTPTPADTAATEDVQLTAEIAALARQLNNNPVTMYEWVRNNIQFTPGYGAQQGAAYTLQAKRGNAFDTASLLLALFRSANIPARYVYGTIALRQAQANQWLGTDSINAAQSLLSQAGIPNQIMGDTLQLEHVWASVYVDYSPSRGAINRQAQHWVELDPSFKALQHKPALDIGNQVSLNEIGVFEAGKVGASCNSDAGQRINTANVQNDYQQYSSRLQTYIQQQGEQLTIAELIGHQTIVARNFGILLNTLPYEVLVQGTQLQSLPDILRQQLTLSLFTDATAQAQGTPLVSFTTDVSRVLTQRITISFSPASQVDADTLASFLPRPHADGSPVLASEFPASLPGYLIFMKAELRLDGKLLSSGGNFPLGTALLGNIASSDPGNHDWQDHPFTLHAGDYHALALDAQGISAAQMQILQARSNTLQAQLAAGQTNHLSRDDVSGEVLYQSALNFFANRDADANILQRIANVREHRQLSFGRAIAPALPQMRFGIVHQVRFPGVLLDIDRLQSAVVSLNKGMDSNSYLSQSHERSAAASHRLLETLYTSKTQPGSAASALRVLANASAQNQPVFVVTSNNLNSVLPQLVLAQSDQQILSQAIAAGMRVVVAQNPSTLGAWQGQAWQIEDPSTGAGAYRLLAAENGLAASAALYLPQGMPYLALAQPFQSANSIEPASQAIQKQDANLVAMLEASTSNLRWRYSPLQNEVITGLFLARLNSSSAGNTATTRTPCDSLITIVAADLDSGKPDLGSMTLPPTISSQPVHAATAAQSYRYAVMASDPQGMALTYQLSSAPSSMRIHNSTGLIQWDNPVTGSYAITLRADNGKAYAEQHYLLTVGKEALPLEISYAITPSIVNLGESVNILLQTNGGTGNISKNIQIDGQNVALDANGQASIKATTSGAHVVVFNATDSLGSVTQRSQYSVRNVQDSSVPSAHIDSPLNDAEITAPVNIIGTATDDNLAYYKLLLRAAGDSSAPWQTIGYGNSNVSQAVLGRFDPTQLQNGIYEIALQVVDVNGQENNHLITLDVYRDLKIGQFAISFEDIQIDASGIPVRVTRTYDTRRKAQSLDFGYGWSVDYQNLQVRKNLGTGLQWELKQRDTFAICLYPVGKRKINVTLPDGKVERFSVANAQECGITPPLIDPRISALPGTNSKLEFDEYFLLQYNGSSLFDNETNETWNPKKFKLTTEDNYVYYLTEGIGITKIVDPFKNTLTYGNNGILHSNGLSISFTRDAANRITGITDPIGKRIIYTYDSAGDLRSVTGRNQAQSRYSYNRSHGLTSYTDPLGIIQARYTYDTDGRLIAVTDANGNSIESTHDIANNKEVVKDRRGNSTIYIYDAAGNVTEKIDALDHKTQYQYDAAGNEISTTNAAKETTLRSFDASSNKQLTETDPLGHSQTWDYDKGSKTVLTSSTDGRGKETRYFYAQDGSQSVREPLGRHTLLGVDGKGNLEQLNIAGRLTRYTYDDKGNKISEKDAAGNITTFGYDANNKEISRSWTFTTMLNGAAQSKTVSSTRKLDEEGRVLEETDALGFTNKTSYNALGLVASHTDPQGRVTRYEYTNRGKLAKTIYPDNSTESQDYDAENNHISSTDRQGRTSKFEYDALNRLSKTIYPDGTSSSIEYDAVGRISATIDNNLNKTQNVYDKAGRLSEVIAPDKRRTRFDYDANGNRTQITTADDAVTKFEYDDLNRLTKTTFPDAKSSSTVWNLDGSKQSETDVLGNTTTYGYDALGRLNQVTQTFKNGSNGDTPYMTQYTFDSSGNKISQQDAQEHLTRWEYDANNRVTARILPAGEKESFTYNAIGIMLSKTDFNGKLTRYSSNTLGQITLIAKHDGSSISNTYYPNGLLESVTVSAGNPVGLQNGKTSYSYDALDRLAKQNNPDGSILSYAYDNAGNITQRSISTPAASGQSASNTVDYTYDSNHRLSSVQDASGKTSYTYHANGRVEQTTLPNGSITLNSYDSNARLTQIVSKKTDGSVIHGVRYTLADNGQRIAVAEFDSLSTLDNGILNNPVRSSSFQYDSLGRLTQELLKNRTGSTARTTDYTYDKVGNRQQKTDTTASGTDITTYTYDANDRLRQEEKTTSTGSVVQTIYTWDANGNLKSKAIGGITTVYLWNSDNRLIEVKQGISEASAQTIARYHYDPQGNRVSKTEAGQYGELDKITQYLVDTNFPYAQTVQEIITQGNTRSENRYLWGHSLIQQTRAGQAVFYHADGLGSVKALSDAGGNVTDTYAYDAFGQIEGRSGTTSNAYRYTGEYFDDQINLQFNRARWYAAGVGRFVSRDPIRGMAKKPLSLNKYIYANTDPLNKLDPSGKVTLTEMDVAIGGSLIIASVALINLNVATPNRIKSFIETETVGIPGHSVHASTGWGADGHRDHPDKNDEEEALAETGENGCEALMWAIGVLKASIEWRLADLERHPGDKNNEVGKGHRRRIEILKKKLAELESLVYFVCEFSKN